MTNSHDQLADALSAAGHAEAARLVRQLGAAERQPPAATPPIGQPAASDPPADNASDAFLRQIAAAQQRAGGWVASPIISGGA